MLVSCLKEGKYRYAFQCFLKPIIGSMGLKVYLPTFAIQKYPSSHGFFMGEVSGLAGLS